MKECEEIYLQFRNKCLYVQLMSRHFICFKNNPYNVLVLDEVVNDIIFLRPSLLRIIKYIRYIISLILFTAKLRDVCQRYGVDLNASDDQQRLVL